MLEGIVQIGRALLEEGNLLDNLIKELPINDKKGRPYLVLKLNFKKDNLELDISEEMDSDTVKKYLYVGTANGPTSPQWFASNKSITYFLSETIFNLTNIDFGDFLNQKLKYVFEKFYVEVNPNAKSNKYRYALNLAYLDNDVNVVNLYNDYSMQGKEDKGFLKVLEKEFEDILKKKYGVKFNEFGFFVICIDDIPLTEYEEYKNKVLEYKSAGSKEDNEDKGKKDSNLCCSLCGSDENVTYDLKKMKIKYYIIDKITFASELDSKKFYKNMLLCENCLNSVIAAEVYIENNLKTQIGDLNLYIIPHFIYGEPLNKEKLDFAVKRLNNSYNTAKNLKDIENLEKDILNLRDEKSYFLVNFMFFRKSNQSTKIQRFIKDVPPYIFEKIAKASKYSHDLIEKSLGFSYKTYLNLQNIYYLIPVKVSGGEATEYRYILNFYENIFTSRPINKEKLIDKFIEAAKVIMLKKEGYNIDNGEIEFYILNSNMLIKFLEKLGCLKEGKGLDVAKLNVKESIKEYISNMGYDEQQTAMFLLGILIGEIGNSQYHRFDGKKPILNKLNFNGIDKSKLIKLSNEVYAKLEQEKIRNYNEVVYADFKKLLDSNLDNWKLNKNENLFYILSGYSYATTKVMMKEEDENEQ
ncbi:TIGR02556 family CRISPR-associated protein [Caloramator sp. CAR-1]|uniref:TIGR02556 family CRISPR-associated protein n=1 Tax=Caloramator sp. CAR-1 TaxID=3062777 RepID=UPI0026E257E9|nr:TIGR02556 family CRISPR-associated protein [Caloramator sp. CAR-1]MDO6354585.1 TIGR02556 family CRISPR-associated protein [Caloramator sp. CAR-1]